MKTEDKAINACVAYLKSKEWNPLVAGFSAIEQGSMKYNFRLIFNFTGKPPKRKIKIKI
ncbi:MAG: hypothetical protein AABY22_33150 [Nanoarchaeota archaeon]